MCEPNQSLSSCIAKSLPHRVYSRIVWCELRQRAYILWRSTCLVSRVLASRPGSQWLWANCFISVDLNLLICKAASVCPPSCYCSQWHNGWESTLEIAWGGLAGADRALRLLVLKVPSPTWGRLEISSLSFSQANFSLLFSHWIHSLLFLVNGEKNLPLQ